MSTPIQLVSTVPSKSIVKTETKEEFHRRIIKLCLPKVCVINSRAYMNSLLLFDPVQTHAVYGCSDEDIPLLKLTLKRYGANRFRLVKNNGFPILCFNARKM